MQKTHVFAALIILFPNVASATSVTVNGSTIGRQGSALSLEPPPAPNDIFNTNLVSGTNSKDVDNTVLDEPPLALPLPQRSQRLNSLSAGTEPLDRELWDIIFSVSDNSTGAPRSSVNARRFNTVGADLFFTNPSLQGTNRLLVTARNLGLAGPDPEVDGMEAFDSRLGGEIPYAGFTSNADLVFSSLTGRNDLLSDSPFAGNNANVLTSGANMGLVSGDEIDALAFDIFLNDDASFEALFSLSPTSPTLGNRGLSAADIFYTNFNNTFEIAGPANILFDFDLTHTNLGLLFGDNVDALDVVETSTIFGLPRDPNFPIDEPVIPTVPLPAPGLLLFAALATLGLRRRTC